MINREITYQRDINKSYMKIPAVKEETLDEVIMLRRGLKGLLPVEKSYTNSQGQYWYNISGKQTLEMYCKMNSIGRDFFERLLLCICNQLEILEWNLLDSNCLVADPELIFLDSLGEEFSFTLYPQRGRNFFEELQQLMEYLLPKVNHEDKEAVSTAYKVYEMCMIEGCSMEEIKRTILKGRVQSLVVELPENSISYEEESAQRLQEPPRESMDKWKHYEEKIKGLFEKTKRILTSRPEELLQKLERKENVPMVVYPEEEKPASNGEMQIHPTVCISLAGGLPQGKLIYEGREGFADFDLGESSCVVGKSYKVKCHINKETVSQFHARIDFFQDDYYIEDLNSTNGTYLNEELLNFKEKRKLQVGDVLRFADVKYRFL